jgi:hypothetical protein
MIAGELQYATELKLSENNESRLSVGLPLRLE